MSNADVEYVIVGDGKYEGSLIYTCGWDKEHAENVLNKMLTDPDEKDLKNMEGMSNFRVKEVKASKCWWNDPFLAN